MAPFFPLAARVPGLNLLCDLNPAAPRFLIFVQKLAQAVDVGDFSAFNNYVLGISGVPPCPRMNAQVDSIVVCFW
jgi:hypothetical protein